MGARKGQAADATSAVRSVAAPAGFGMILQRARVHALIEARLPGAVWLHGPTGAGKTVALRTYLEQAGLASLWVTLDERHREPAALFATITGASRVARASLPAFSPEHRDDPAAFARDYFSKLDEVLPLQQALVVDDAHLADESTSLFVEAIGMLGERRRLFFASQLVPGPRFAPLLAGSKLWTIGHRQLAFDVDEAKGLAHRLGTELPMVNALLAATDGWAAGLMLAMQLGPPSSDDTGDPLGSLRSPLAHLIAAQVLRGVAPDEFLRLRVLADLPQVPMELVDVASEWEAACAHLNRLADRGLFVERVASERPRTGATGADTVRLAKGSWRLHDLFRAALHEAGTERGSDPAMARTLAASLIGIDRLDLAWQLAAAGEPAGLDELVDRYGSSALRDASLPLLREVTAKRGPPTPSLAYWRTRALLGSDEDAAIESAEVAWIGFDARADASRKGLAASLAIFAMFASMENVRTIGPWIERFKEVSRGDCTTATARDEQAIRCAAEVMHDMHFGGRSSGGDVAAMQDRLLSHVVADALPPDELVLAGSLLVAAMQRTNRVIDAEAAITRIEALEAFALAAPHVRASWFLESGYHHVRVGAPKSARHAFGRCFALAEENALPKTKVGALIGLVRAALAAGDMVAARDDFERIGLVGTRSAGAQSALILHLRARIELGTNEPQRALQSNDAATRLLEEHGYPAAANRMFDVARMQILYDLGRHAECDALAERLLSEGPPEDRERTHVTVGILRAVRQWDRDRVGAEALLHDSLVSAERLDVANFVPLLPRVATVAAAHALDLGISVDFVKHAIRARRLPAPLIAPRDWPWPLRVRVLGPFVLERDGEPMVFTGKAQQKPLELLKYLACERGMTSETRALTAVLWPDADGDGGRKNLEVTVSRLRKLLDDDTLVLVKEGRVSLDTSRVSSDAREFIELCVTCETTIAPSSARAAAEGLAAHLLSAFTSLPFENDESLTWREGIRERFRGALVRAVRALTGVFDDSGHPDHSIALLEATITREPLAEGLYQSLMRAYIRKGEQAEAMRVYRHCRQMLSILIGAAPSAETERLKDSIHSPGEKR